MSNLQIRLLGDFQIVHQGAPLNAFESVRLQSLLAFLLLHRDAPWTFKVKENLPFKDSGQDAKTANTRQPSARG